MTYGCKDREIKQSRVVQDGYYRSAETNAPQPRFTRIVSPWSGPVPCGYDDKGTDSRCDGCSLNERATESKE